ncbi:MAG TPA: hypothetical protein VGQ13_06895 [Nitrososphaera sp.]|jgi:hypothetical protein|nr:hypothetical protein [Nitrososphaera sp.]
MQMEIASQTVLARLKSSSDEGSSSVSLNQIKMWVVPQMGEQDQDYTINQSYFATLLNQTIIDLLAKGYITSSMHDGVEDGDAEMFSLTVKGARYVEELTAASVEQ